MMLKAVCLFDKRKKKNAMRIKNVGVDGGETWRDKSKDK